MKNIVGFATLLLAVPAIRAEQSIEIRVYESPADYCERIIQDATEPLLAEYITRLENIAKKFQASGDIRSLSDINSEVDRAKKHMNQDDKVLSRYPELHKVSQELGYKQYLQKTELSSLTIAILEAAAKRLTIQGELDKAKAVLAEIQQISAEYCSSETGFGRLRYGLHPNDVLLPDYIEVVKPGPVIGRDPTGSKLQPGDRLMVFEMARENIIVCPVTLAGILGWTPDTVSVMELELNSTLDSELTLRESYGDDYQYGDGSGSGRIGQLIARTRQRREAFARSVRTIEGWGRFATASISAKITNLEDHSMIRRSWSERLSRDYGVLVGRLPTTKRANSLNELKSRYEPSEIISSDFATTVLEPRHYYASEFRLLKFDGKTAIASPSQQDSVPIVALRFDDSLPVQRVPFTSGLIVEFVGRFSGKEDIKLADGTITTLPVLHCTGLQSGSYFASTEVIHRVIGSVNAEEEPNGSPFPSASIAPTAAMTTGLAIASPATQTAPASVALASERLPLEQRQPNMQALVAKYTPDKRYFPNLDYRASTSDELGAAMDELAKYPTESHIRGIPLEGGYGVAEVFRKTQFELGKNYLLYRVSLSDEHEGEFALTAPPDETWIVSNDSRGPIALIMIRNEPIHPFKRSEAIMVAQYAGRKVVPKRNGSRFGIAGVSKHRI